MKEVSIDHVCLDEPGLKPTHRNYSGIKFLSGGMGTMPEVTRGEGGLLKIKKRPHMHGYNRRVSPDL